MIKIKSICRSCECNTKCKVIMKLKHLFYLLFIGFFLIILITSLMKESIIPMIPESIEDLVAQYSLKDLQTLNDHLTDHLSKTEKKIEDYPSLQQLPKVYSQSDPKLIKLIQDKFLIPPPSSGEYNLQRQASITAQSRVVREVLNDKSNGFFIECGALDGEARSNSLFLEKNNNWQGILIEGDPGSWKSVISKNRRRSWFLPTCLSLKTETMFATFASRGHVGQIISHPEKYKKHREEWFNVTCFPLYSILLALGNPTVDYFSLDIEGDELAVLKTIPFDKVDIKVLSVEIIHGGERGDGPNDLDDYMKSQGYTFYGKQSYDHMFVKNDLI